MLVLTRRESEKILFPTLGISIEVLKIQGKKSRLGIVAPEDIPVVRHECVLKNGNRRKGNAGNAIDFTSDVFASNEKLSQLFHVIQNRLNKATSTLNALHQTLEAEHEIDQESQAILTKLFKELRALESETNRVLEGSGITANETRQALLIEDGACERHLLGEYLELSGFEVVTAEDGQEGLDFLSMHSPPDVVLVDMMMPRVNGPTFVQQVRSNPNLIGLSIFAISSKSQSEIEESYGITAVDRWFSKPVSPKKLVNEITLHLASKSLAG